jgi:FO synthase
MQVGDKGLAHCRDSDPRTAAWFAEAEKILAALRAVPVPELLDDACVIARAAHGATITYSPKVFIPLTKLCRDVCHYCTFAEVPQSGRRAYMTPDEVRAVARAGAEAGCGEALFTLGEEPERRYAVARAELAELGYPSTNAYCAAMADMVQCEFGLVTHVNAGVMSVEELRAFRKVSGSQGLMLETVSERLCERGQAHFGSPGKAPAVRLRMIEAAGELAIPFTTGILIGIGETPVERIASLLAIRDLHAAHGHIQEAIVQNFLPKPGTKMAGAQAVSFDELLWTTAVARRLLQPEVSLQVPPNLSFERFGALLEAGINDWGGISPITPDHVNPEAAWPAIDRLARETARYGLDLAPRLPVYPRWLFESRRWIDPAVEPVIRRRAEGQGLLRDTDWAPGMKDKPVPVRAPAITPIGPEIDRLLLRAEAGDRLEAEAIVDLMQARGGAYDAVLAAADEMRRRDAGEVITYVVNRNINYTNICTYSCGFCAFSKGKTHENLRGKPYDLSEGEIGRRVAEAWARGATEVCMQGGIHPRFTGKDYLAILRTAKEAAPAIHVHAFSPLEVYHGASTLDMAEADYLAMLRDAGLGSLPGTAAEILVDSVRAKICADKLNTAEWLRVVGTAHDVGLRTTATVMFGHVEQQIDVAEHLLAIRDLQERTGGFTEFVPLPFVHSEAPIALRGRTRKGPTFRETMLIHAVSRLVFGALIPNLQVSWVKLGVKGVRQALDAGINDLGGTLMNESISRAAGADHGQELPPAEMEAIARAAGRSVRQRTTLYGAPAELQRERSFFAAPLAPLVQTAPTKRRIAAPLADA